MARRRHPWQLDGVEQQFSMGAACLLSRPGARVVPFGHSGSLGRCTTTPPVLGASYTLIMVGKMVLLKPQTSNLKPQNLQNQNNP